MTHHVFRAKAFKWTVVAIGVVLAMRLFFVQQLLAALLIFSVLFVCLAIVAMTLFGLDLAWRTALGGAESIVMALARQRRSSAYVNHSPVVNMLTPVLVRRATLHK